MTKTAFPNYAAVLLLVLVPTVSSIHHGTMKRMKDSPATSVGERCLGLHGIHEQDHVIGPHAHSHVTFPEIAEAMCKDIERVPACVASYLPHGDAAARMMSRVTSQATITSAIQELCVLGLPDLKRDAPCMAPTNETLRCHADFHEDVARWAAVEGNASDSELTKQACRLRVSVITCKTAEYRKCSPAAADALYNYMIAATTPACRELTRVTSPYNDYVADGAAGRGVPGTMVAVVVTAVALAMPLWLH